MTRVGSQRNSKKKMVLHTQFVINNFSSLRTFYDFFSACLSKHVATYATCCDCRLLPVPHLPIPSRPIQRLERRGDGGGGVFQSFPGCFGEKPFALAGSRTPDSPASSLIAIETWSDKRQLPHKIRTQKWPISWAVRWRHCVSPRSHSLTLRWLMSYIYIYGAPILDVSRSHTTTQHSR